MSYAPQPIREWRNPAPWVTCTIDSGTMGAAKATRGGVPSTGAEADRLWAKVDPTHALTGYGSGTLRKGQRALYGYEPAHYGGSWPVLAAHLGDPHVGVVFYGSYPSMPAAVRKVSRDPGYGGLHAVYGQSDGSGNVGIFDPLGTKGVTIVPVAELQAFAGNPATNFEHDVYAEASWTNLMPAQDFTDVPPEHTFYGDIEWMSRNGITAGISNGDGSYRYEPDRAVTRGEMAAFLHRFAKKAGLDLP